MQHFDDFAQMQRDAERRVMEMQRRAMAAVDSVECPAQAPEPEPPQKAEELPKNPPSANFLSLLKGLELNEQDSESMLLITIIMLLQREGADERLIFALLYILL